MISKKEKEELLKLQKEVKALQNQTKKLVKGKEFEALVNYFIDCNRALNLFLVYYKSTLVEKKDKAKFEKFVKKLRNNCDVPNYVHK